MEIFASLSFLIALHVVPVSQGVSGMSQETLAAYPMNIGIERWPVK